MMTVRLRLPGIVAGWFLRERSKGERTASRLSLRCWPWDCDVYRHMNNSRYLALMDLGRYHFVLVSGLWREIWRHRAFPVLARAEIDYRRPIHPFQKFVLETAQHRIGRTSVVLSQRFVMDGQVAAEALVTVTFVKGGRPTEVAPLLQPLAHLAEAAAATRQP